MHEPVCSPWLPPPRYPDHGTPPLVLTDPPRKQYEQPVPRLPSPELQQCHATAAPIKRHASPIHLSLEDVIPSTYAVVPLVIAIDTTVLWPYSLRMPIANAEVSQLQHQLLESREYFHSGFRYKRQGKV